MQVTIYSLEMGSPAQLQEKPRPDAELTVEECRIKQFAVNRFLYGFVGAAWSWTDKLAWSDEEWRRYAESDAVRTWVAYLQGSPAGYYELQRRDDGAVEIAYFGLAPPFIGKGLGGYLLTHAVASAWRWDARRVVVRTCTLDHPSALQNYLARGFKLCREETVDRAP